MEFIPEIMVIEGALSKSKPAKFAHIYVAGVCMICSD